ncbi:MAG: hypothetical protein DI601_13630 [Azospirillum brasilense]|nr:MAG: hypothetical protein DI601_13630 [Azospirillum brasilense]
MSHSVIPFPAPSHGTTPQDRQAALAWSYRHPGWEVVPLVNEDVPGIVLASPHDGGKAGWAIERLGRAVIAVQFDDPEPLGEFARIEDALAAIERAAA